MQGFWEKNIKKSPVSETRQPHKEHTIDTNTVEPLSKPPSHFKISGEHTDSGRVSPSKNKSSPRIESKQSKEPLLKSSLKASEEHGCEHTEEGGSPTISKKSLKLSKELILPETPETKNRTSSPRFGLRKASRGKEEKGKEGIVIESSDKQPTISVNAFKDIMLKNKDMNQIEKIQNVSSSEQENEPEQFYKLNLKKMIAKHTDERFHAIVGAYADKTLQTKPDAKAFEERIQFIDYFKLINQELTKLQSDKYKTIQSMVEVLGSAYGSVKRTKTMHNKYCRDLLNAIRFCMLASEAACGNSKYLPESNKTPKEKIILFWDGFILFAIGNLADEEKENFNDLHGMLLDEFQRCFLMSKQLDYIKELQVARAENNNVPCCISWSYLNVCLDYNNVYIGSDLDRIKESYKESYFGLAEQFIFLPDFWSFVRNTAKEIKNHNPSYYESLMTIDRLFLKSSVFEDYEPGVKNNASYRPK